MGHDADHGAEGVLVFVEVGGRHVHREGEARRGEQLHGETHCDDAAHRAEAPDLADHVAEDVGEGEEEEGAVRDEAVELEDTEVDVQVGEEEHGLRGRDVGDEHHADEQRDDGEERVGRY